MDPHLFQLMVEQAQDYALFLLDAEGCVITWNRGVEGIRGYTFDEIRGRHFSVSYPREDIERASQLEAVIEELSTPVLARKVCCSCP